jgi:Raf kinase inhibitor-like YbhB/YbcL family protein
VRALLVALLALAATACDGTVDPDPAVPQSISVTSPAFEDGADIPTEHTCDGADEPPRLDWEAVPPEAAETVVIVDDPDAPGGTFVHWLVAGLEPAAAALEDPPSGAVEGRNDFGEEGWAGPCPPAGDEPHTYRFRVIAVAEPTGVEAGFSAAELEERIAASGLAEGVLTGRYGR